MPVIEIIRHKTFAVVRQTAKSAKVSCHKSFMIYGMLSSIGVSALVIITLHRLYNQVLRNTAKSDVKVGRT